MMRDSADVSKKIRVLVVDDSAFMRKIIGDILEKEKDIEVVDFARNGKEAIEKARLHQPDIITLDIEMPILSGLDALSGLMSIQPAPKVIMVSSLTTEGADATIKALERGALDFIAKPTRSLFTFDTDGLKEDLLRKVRNLASTRIKSSYTSKFETVKSPLTQAIKSQGVVAGKLKYIIAIGTSTGGPRALQEVIPLFPKDIPAAILIVQHMPPGFTKSLADRLDSLSYINVKEAQSGDVLKPGCAYLAPGDFHMVLNRLNSDEYKIELNKNPQVTGHRPSVNVMMDSVAGIVTNKNIIAVMMTGMGSDGSEGILKIKKNGGKTIAQDEDTCVVYGMPKSAVAVGAVDKIVPLQEITREALKFMGV